jgi:Spy/CpxP family protein refolding chaperone
MNTPLIKRAISQGVMLFSFVILLGSGLHAASIPDPAIDQKQAIDQMHHKLHDDQASFKASEAQALKELNEMTIREDVKIDDVNAKIDELMAAKTQIMRLRYGHLVEMRTILTEEQKVGYDKALLKRSAVK